MTGIEVRCGDDILFRGAVTSYGWLYNEDGSTYYPQITISTSNEPKKEVTTNVEPSVLTIYQLLNDPELTHKGIARAWFIGAFVCIANTMFILFADELFRWQLRFRIDDVYSVEPSDWEITRRYIAWTFFMIAALLIYILGLQ